MAENLTDIFIMDMKKFTTAELNIDLAACISDIKVCKEALAIGVRYYNEGKDKVGVRLSINTLLQKAIEAELTRRSSENRSNHGNRQV